MERIVQVRPEGNSMSVIGIDPAYAKPIAFTYPYRNTVSEASCEMHTGGDAV